MAPARPALGATMRLYDEADLRRLDGGADGGDDGALRIDQRLVGVDRALRDEVLREQVLAARELALGVGERGLVLRELRLRLGDVDLVVARVEREQQLAGADELAFADVHLLDRRWRPAAGSRRCSAPSRCRWPRASRRRRASATATVRDADRRARRAPTLPDAAGAAGAAAGSACAPRLRLLARHRRSPHRPLRAR